MAAIVMPLHSAFSPDTISPNSPAPYQTTSFFIDRSSTSSDTLIPPPSPYPQQVDPSPVDSNGTENTEIEDDPQTSKHEEPSDEEEDTPKPPDVGTKSPMSPQAALSAIDTSVAAISASDDAPQSVVHAPSGFKQFEAGRSPSRPPTGKAEIRVVSPSTPEANLEIDDRRSSLTASLNTSIPPASLHDWQTPQAQTRQELEAEWRRRGKGNRSLEDIPETSDVDKSISDNHDEAGGGNALERAGAHLSALEDQVAQLKTALSECWTLCNTLASLSANYRERMFSFSGSGEKQEQAWKSCWTLCQSLYETRDEDFTTQLQPTLELCRTFCQALFEARQRVDENTDSVLRVSFELNNHLYNTHDRNLPDAFRERTLDFYLTLCHRLMKQRTSLPKETDALLRACWSLAEMLFSLRENNREGRPPDEELLGSAVQACWDLCNLFREGWSQIRPDRSTPKASQTTFSHTSYGPPSRSDSHASSLSSSAQSHNASYRSAKSHVPETPTTFIDDDTGDSPAEPDVPNILVLGPDPSRRGNARWSSNVSTMSGYSDASSQRTVSTATAGSEDVHVMRIMLLVLKAAMNAGYQPRSPSAGASIAAGLAEQPSHTLATFVRSLPPNSFGPAPWQTKLLDSYKKLLMQDVSLRQSHSLLNRRASAADLARSVTWMVRQGSAAHGDAGGGYACLKDLYRLVFGFPVEEGGGRADVGIST